MKIRSLHGLLTLCLFALLAARAGALTIVQTATLPLVKDLNPGTGFGTWDFDAFAPAGGGTLTAVSLETSFSLVIAVPVIGDWTAGFTLGSGVGFYHTSQFGFGFPGSFVVTFDPPSFTPSQLANFLDPAQSKVRFGANVRDGFPFPGGPSFAFISGDATFVLTYEYETSSASVPEAGNTGLFLSGALACLWIATRRRAFLAH
jgi:hypothetical protein